MRNSAGLQRGIFYATFFYGISTLFSQALMSIGAAVLFAVVAADWLIRRQWPTGRWRESPWRLYLELSGALVLTIATSLLAAALFPLRYAGHTVLVHSITEVAKTWYFVWPPLIAWALLRLEPKQRERVFWAWLVFACALGFVGVQQHWTGWPRPQLIPTQAGAATRFHATLFLGHHLSVASILIFPFFVGLDRLRAPARPWVSVLLGFGLFALGATLFLTYSRTLWAGMALGVLFWIWLSLPRRWGVGATIVALMIGLLLMQSSAIRDRVTHQIGIAPRIELWEANWEFFKQRPLTGVGWLKNEELAGHYFFEKYPGRKVFSGRAHNNVLEILAQLGILGFAAWVCWSLWVTIRFWRLGKLGQWGLLSAWAVFHINGLTQVNQWEGKVLHQLCWMLAWSGVWWAQRTAKRPRS